MRAAVGRESNGTPGTRGKSAIGRRPTCGMPAAICAAASIDYRRMRLREQTNRQRSASGRC